MLVAALAAIACPLVARARLVERDMRVRTHTGALTRFYLDALLGLVALRAHRGEQALREEHRRLLAAWCRSALDRQRLVVAVDAAVMLVGYGLACWLVLGFLGRHPGSPNGLLFVSWVLALPGFGQEAVALASRYAVPRNVTARLLEPLREQEVEKAGAAGPGSDPPPNDDRAGEPAPAPGVAVEFRDVTLLLAGHVVLDHVQLHIEPGVHVAVVGASGAGKTSLVGLLLGRFAPTRGAVLVDGLPLDPAVLTGLRRATAWADPAVHLWNRSLFDNLAYGHLDPTLERIGTAVALADLGAVAAKLPEGLDTPLGESGSLISAGEGQRVRFGRALLRPSARLVVLDEALRGLDRPRRRDLVAAGRRHWAAATLIYVTHDLTETLDFDQVVVMADGRIVETGPPTRLAAQTGSRFRSMLDEHRCLERELWQGSGWRQLEMRDGTLVERRPAQEAPRP